MKKIDDRPLSPEEIKKLAAEEDERDRKRFERTTFIVFDIILPTVVTIVTTVILSMLEKRFLPDLLL